MTRKDGRHQQGLVRFPLSDPAWRNSGEGGMVVQIWVDDLYLNREQGAFGWTLCCGGMNIEVHEQECLERVYNVSERHWEQGTNDEFLPHLRFDSQYAASNNLGTASRCNLLAAMTIGTSTWSGWSDAESQYWGASPADLTDAGLAFLQQILELYAGCRVYLVTWLDT